MEARLQDAESQSRGKNNTAKLDKASSSQSGNIDDPEAATLSVELGKGIRQQFCGQKPSLLRVE